MAGRRAWQKLLTPFRKADVCIADASWHRLLATSRLFSRIEARALLRLRSLCGEFLARKTFSAAAGHELDDAQCLAIAALACLPVLELGIDWLDGWHEVIVYPGGFRVRRTHHDDESGVVTEFDDDLIGEAWDRGPLVLSWADIAADLANPFDGFNVVIHEVTHKLDMLDGVIDGVPRLPPSIGREEWIATMQAAFDDLVRRVECGLDCAIDPYASESVDEFFAVSAELYFSDEALLVEAMPSVARLLRRFFAGSHANSGPRGTDRAKRASAGEPPLD